MMRLTDWCKEVHAIARRKGWHSAEAPTVHQIGTWIALAHSELSEALEELRKHEDLGMRIENGKPEGFVVEMADAVIRIMDTCEALGLDLEGAIRCKSTFNEGRETRHGGKRV